MKKKILSLLFVMTMLVLALSGCSLFGSENGGNGGNGSPDGVKITDKFTLTAPDGLDYDKVYVVKAEPTADNLVGEYNEVNGMLAMYSVIYAKADTPVGEYGIFVLPDQAGVDSMVEEVGEGVYTMPEEDPFVMLYFTDADALAANITLYQSYGMLNDPCTVSDYANMCAEMYGGILVD